MKPLLHAESSARKWGGLPEEYLPIHDFMDSSKAAFSDNRHRALTHNNWFIFVVEKVFGHTITVTIGNQPCEVCQGNGKFKGTEQGGRVFYYACDRCLSGLVSKTRDVSVRDICEQHILEDFGGKYIPTVSDYLSGMEFQPWMNNGIKGMPESQRKINHNTKRKVVMSFD